MKCKIYLEINGEEIVLESDLTPGYLTDEELINSLKNNSEKLDELKKVLHKTLSSDKRTPTFTLKDYMNTKGLYGNETVKSIQSKFGIEFPENIDAEILLVNHLNLNGKKISERVINSFGNEIFVIHDYNDAKKLSHFLRVRELIRSKSFLFDEETSPHYKTLNEILEYVNSTRKNNKFSDIYSMLESYIEDNEKFLKLMLSDSRSVSVILEKLTREIRDYSGRVQYDDKFVNYIQNTSKYVNKSYTITFDGVYNALKTYQSDLFKTLKITSKNKFYEVLQEDDIQDFILKTLEIDDIKMLSKKENISSETKQLILDLYEYNLGFKQIFDILFKSEPTFPFKFQKFDSKNIIFKAEPKTLYEKYGLSYSTLNLFEVKETFRGYKIFGRNVDGKEEYIPSRVYLSENIFGRKFDTIDEAKDYVNNLILNENPNFSGLNLFNNSLIAFKFRQKTEEGEYILDYDDYKINSKLLLQVGTIIDSIDIPVDPKTVFYNGEDVFIENPGYDLKFFLKLVNSWGISDFTKSKIIEKMDDPEKAVTFIYKINEFLKGDRDSEEALDKMIEIADEIQSKPVKSYYIESKNKNEYTIIPTEPNSVSNYRSKQILPSVTLMENISKIFKDKFNVNINLLTSEEINLKFPSIDANISKAFIRNGEIYVNTTIASTSDLIHEYSHLLLGVLKSNPELRSNYELLLLLVASKSKNLVLKLSTIYKDLSQMDLLEEVFVSRFSDYVIGNLNLSDLENIFLENEEFIKETSLIVFNNKINDLKSFYGNSLASILERFSSDVSQLLSLDVNFDETYVARQYSNWISKLIAEGNIIENCIV